MYCRRNFKFKLKKKVMHRNELFFCIFIFKTIIIVRYRNVFNFKNVVESFDFGQKMRVTRIEKNIYTIQLRIRRSVFTVNLYVMKYNRRL